MKPLVTDELWIRIGPLLPPEPTRRFRFPGRKPLDRRKVFTGILFALKTGIAWDDLPTDLGCGCGKTCRRYLRLWHEAGVWRQLHNLLLAEFNAADQIDCNRALVDATFAKAPKGGEDTGPNPTDRSKSGSKHYMLTDAQGIPLAATVVAANVNEVTQVFWFSLTSTRSAANLVPTETFPTDYRAVAVMTPNQSANCYTGWESRLSWPHVIPSTAAAWVSIAGSSSDRSPGSIPLAGCGVASTASLRSKKRFCVSVLLWYACGS